MKYKLDYFNNFNDSFLFWLKKYVSFKLSSLSNVNIKDPKELIKINASLKQCDCFDELDSLIKKARNLGLGGINTYFNPLKKIFIILKEYNLKSLSQIDEEILSEILAIATSNLSDASKKNYRIAVINFFSFIDKQNENLGLSYNFNIELKNWGGIRGNKGKKLPEYMSEEEIKNFLDALEKFEFKKNGVRNILIIKIILFTGIRVSEAINLKFKDISRENEILILRIRAKANKYRVVMLNANLVEKEFNQLEINYKNEANNIFVNKFGKPLSQAYISKIIEKILLSAGIRKEKNGAHMLRHSFATLLYKKQKDLVLIQEALGHSSLETSRIYTHFDNQKLKLAANTIKDIYKK